MALDWSTCDWGGFTSVVKSLDFWSGWLVSSLKHSQRGAEGAILLRFFRTADPLASALAVALALAAVCFLLSLPTNRHSWVDKMWSVAPIYYVWHFALHDQLAGGAAGPVPLNPRLLAMASVVTFWGSRLTWNFARKGGYRWTDEDYRWPWLRDRVHPLLFFVFNLTFIAVIQHVLLLAIVAPAYLAWANVSRPLSALDAAAAALVVFFLWMEITADQQQWAFQTAKHALLRAGKPLPPALSRGFCTTGLFRYSRHPNFFAEQMIWWSFYLFGVAASGRWLNWTVVGPAFLTMLFQGSTWLTELISSAKYPRYAEYQQTTSRLLPWFPGEPREAAEEEEEEVDEGLEEEKEQLKQTDSEDDSDEDSSSEGTEDGSEEGSEEEEEEEEEEAPRPAPSARKARAPPAAAKPAPRAAPKAAPKAPAAEEGTSEEEGEEEETPKRSRRAAGSRSGAAAAPGPAKPRSGRARAAKVAAAEVLAQGEEKKAEAPAAAARPSRTPRKAAKASGGEAPAPVRQSSRLRAKVSGA